MRYKKNREYACLVKRNTRLGLFTLWVLVVLGFLILIQSINQPQRPLLDPRGKEPISMVQKVKAAEPPFCKDAISCIRDVGEELGQDNRTIMTMIRIAQKESSMNPRAKNKSSSASGLFQIIAGTWYSNDCVGDKWNAEDNIRCAYKIQSKRGFQPWEVCHTKVANCY